MRQDLTKRIVELNEALFATGRLTSHEEWPDLELTYPQLRVLSALAQGPKRMSGLVESLGGQPSTMSAIVDRLVAKGLVTRGESPTDRRVVLCMLTQQGREVMEQFARMNRLHLEELITYLTDEEMATLIRAMEALVRVAEQQTRASETAAETARERT